jgi:hypothetical protein
VNSLIRVTADYPSILLPVPPIPANRVCSTTQSIQAIVGRVCKSAIVGCRCCSRMHSKMHAEMAAVSRPLGSRFAGRRASERGSSRLPWLRFLVPHSPIHEFRVRDSDTMQHEPDEEGRCPGVVL